ncbi:MAG: hypothetical protein WDW38_010838 [Sanguina aurantia]
MLAGKTALITGSTSGIGLEMFKMLASAGANVAMHGMGDPAKLTGIRDAVAAEHDIKTFYSDADLRKPKDIREMMQKIHSEFGQVDILVNNAGIQFVSPVHELPEDKWDDIVAVCLTAAFHTTKAVLPGMMEAKWGRIINTGSMHSVVASPYKSAYNAAKHGIAGLTKTVALEVATMNITCNAICPGYVYTDLVKNQVIATAKVRGIPVEKVISDVMLADQPTKKFVNPEDIAGMVLYLCGPHSSSITGACLSVDGGWTSR